jgi:hypothetical protein
MTVLNSLVPVLALLVTVRRYSLVTVQGSLVTVLDF